MCLHQLSERVEDLCQRCFHPLYDKMVGCGVWTNCHFAMSQWGFGDAHMIVSKDGDAVLFDDPRLVQFGTVLLFYPGVERMEEFVGGVSVEGHGMGQGAHAVNIGVGEAIDHCPVVFADHVVVLVHLADVGIAVLDDAFLFIDGGQGKNPSIGDFIEAFDKINSDNIFVFPNNSNIIMAARQAKELYKSSNIFVIPSKNLGQAYAAMAMLDYSFDTPEEVEKNFLENMDYVETGMICKAIRSVEYKDLSVKNNDYIGFSNKKVLSSNTDKIAALKELCDGLNIGEKEIATVIFGADTTEDDKREARKMFSENFKDKEYYEIDGKQEIYDFIVILE